MCELMPSNHSEHLEKLAKLVRPIARRIAEAQASSAAADSIADSAQDASSLLPGGSGFFSEYSGHDANQLRPADTLGAALSEQKANAVFERLRQITLQQHAKNFGQLDAKTQALARIGGLIHLHREEFGQRVYHFQACNQLIAVLDRPKKRLFLKRQLAALDFSDVSTISKPSTTSAPGTDFERMSLQDAVWTYARHDPEALLDLPAQLGLGWLHLRKLPQVSPQLLAAADMAVIRKLLIREQRFDQLRRQAQPTELLALLSTLASLYLARSITVSAAD
jgi:hypothetical protein